MLHTCSKERLEEKIKTFSRFGATANGGITRFTLSPEAIAARNEFKKRVLALGMQFKTDDMGTMYATIPGEDNQLPAILSGSHMDSVRQGGNYDGILGVLTALEAAETIVTNQITHRHPITVVVWTNEEGVRFEPGMVASGVILGKYDTSDIYPIKDKDGITFLEALEASGFLGQKENRASKENTKALIELHIEQGPILTSEKKTIGIVDGVCGMLCYKFTFYGQADHAGTTPMSYRKDAFYAAAKTLDYLHQKLDQLDDKLVYTTGEISCHPNLHTIIPDEFSFLLDARHYNPAVIQQVLDVIHTVPDMVAGCRVTYEEAWSRNTVYFDSKLVSFVDQNANAFGYSNMHIYSGAGHDAQYIAGVIPTTMIFVPSIDGRSHCEQEYTPMEDCYQGANVLLNTILNTDES